MSWLLAAYGVVTIAVLLYRVRLARLRRALEAEISVLKR
jgi:CcmD family protein